MAIYDLYFKRQRALENVDDVYIYDKLPLGLKNQIIHMWDEVIPKDISYERSPSNSIRQNLYKKVSKTISKEFGLEALNKPIQFQKGYYEEISYYFRNLEKVDYELSLIEIMNMFILDYCKKNQLIALNYIDELNQRFREASVGYQYENGQIIRVDSQYIHAEAVKPTLKLLSKPMYKGAQDEFLKAHEHYREQRYKEMMVECLKAYESTLKVIIQKHNWGYNDKDTADALTGKVMQNNLIPKYWQQYFKGLKNTLTSGLPTARNNEGGHGQGEEIKNPPDYLAGYVLHMTASAIVFLANAEENLKPVQGELAKRNPPNVINKSNQIP